VRTTLKRGFGRTATADGNGRTVVPPSTLTAMRRYRQPPPPPRSGWRLVGRFLFWAAAALVMVALGLVGGVYVWLHESAAALKPRSEDVKAAQARLDDVPPPNRAAIALVLGYDRRFGESEGTPSRSDTVMLLRADPQTNSISMLSFPRDMVVDIHCPGRSPFRSRINAAYSTCGAKGTLETVKAATGLPINYLITVNFRGFKKVVNTLGGVWVDVDRRYFNDNSGLGPGFTYATINLQPGYQLLTGGSALDFVRFRHTDSDYYRVARQQLFVTAMKEQFSKSFSITKVPKLVGAIKTNVEIGVGGGKELNLGKLVSYARFAYGLPPGHFFQSKIEGLTGYSELYTDSTNLERAVAEFVSPDVEAPRVATAVALGRKLRTAAPKPEQTTIVTLNGNGREGSAATAGYLLGQRGYRVISPPPNATGNAPSFDYFHTKAYFDPAQKGAEAAARVVAKAFGAADVSRVPPPIKPLSNRAMVTVVTGQTFHGTLAPPPVSRTLKREPARVVSNRAATESMLRGVKAKVRFPLQVPTVLESGSILDREVPIRTYRIDGDHNAVRLTFRTGGNQYWGIEMTDWDDAPVLDGRNFRHTLGGRRFDFYYRGPKLHMVVLRQGGATYWVVNSLLDTLSNETMIAIAKGLRPLDPPKRAKIKAKAQTRAGN
jgi:LCP family protein required for cell wall assembly